MKMLNNEESIVGLVTIHIKYFSLFHYLVLDI